MGRQTKKPKTRRKKDPKELRTTETQGLFFLKEASRLRSCVGPIIEYFRTYVYAVLRILRSDLWSLTSSDDKGVNDDDTEASYEGFLADDGLHNVSIVAMDCEMVGVGRKGIESMLARCSIVTLKGVEGNCSNISNHSDTTHSLRQETENYVVTACASADSVSCFQAVTVLYDKLVKPTKTVVDYRTEYSGVTRDTLLGDGPLRVISFELCRAEVAQLLSSLEGKNVLLVGHALMNDMDALRLTVRRICKSAGY